MTVAAIIALTLVVLASAVADTMRPG